VSTRGQRPRDTLVAFRECLSLDVVQRVARARFHRLRTRARASGGNAIISSVSVSASCTSRFRSMARIESVDPGVASSPFSSSSSPSRFAALYALLSTCLGLSASMFAANPRSEPARTANNVRSSLGRAWQRANAA